MDGKALGTPSAHVSEDESRRVAEESRQVEWSEPSFMKELFLGAFRFDLLDPYPMRTSGGRSSRSSTTPSRTSSSTSGTPVEIDATGEYPPRCLERLRELGAFGMKIPREYGGLGFDQVEYGRIMETAGGYDGSLTALLSAHQSIGVPQPVKLFGSTT
jgi:alkylation response protein AidB-like acyl-CoA dehydrogenase